MTEGHKGKNLLEEVSSYVTSHLVLPDIIRRAVHSIRTEKDNSDKDDELEKLISIMKQNGSLKTQKVESAIRNIPRDLFVDNQFKKYAYEDRPLVTKRFQTISQPSVVARMTEWLDVREGQKVLEVGAGSGWQSAILGFLVGTGKVYTIERFPELVEFARKNLENTGVKNVEVIQGDGTQGLPEKAPFDRIMVTAACKEVPQHLLDQLAMDGMLIAPVGEYWQHMVLLKKTKDRIEDVKREFGYVFVPLVGTHEEKGK